MSSFRVEMMETESLNSLVAFVSNPCHNDLCNKTNQCNLAVFLKVGSQSNHGKNCLAVAQK